MKKSLFKTIALVIAIAATAAPVAVVAAEAPSTEIASKDAPRARVQSGNLVIEVPGDATCHVTIYALTGQVVKQLDAAPGSTNVELPAGYYIVRLGHTTVKIAVK